MADAIRFSREFVRLLFADRRMFGKPHVENEALRRELALQVKNPQTIHE